MPTFRMEGTVLNKRPFGESDAMVSALTVTRGLETFVAKGAFRSRRRLVGGLEPFTRTEFCVYQSRPGKLAVIQDLKVLTPRFELYRDLDVFTRLAGVSDFLTQSLPPGVPEYEVYDLFEALLSAVCAGGRAESLVLSFYLRAFGALGWRMDIGACAVCRKVPGIEGTYMLDFSEGRLYCPACRNTPAPAGSASPTPQVPASPAPAGSASPTPQVSASPAPAGSADPTPARDRTDMTLPQAKGLSNLVLPPRLKSGIAADPPIERFLKHLIDRYLLWHTSVVLQNETPAPARTIHPE